MIQRWFALSRRVLRVALLFLTDAWVSMLPRKHGNAALVIRLDAIGDFVVWLQSGAADIAVELRRTHPRVILLANAAWAPLATELNVWDEVVAIDPGRFVTNLNYRIRTIAMVRALGFNTAVQPRAARMFLLDDALVRTCGALVRVGSAALAANMSATLRSLGDRGYTKIISVPLALTEHESARGTAFARAFCQSSGAVVSTKQLSSLPKPPLFPNERFIVVAVGAGSSGRQWPIEKFAALLTELSAAHGLLCVLVGTAAEQLLASQLKQLTNAPIADLCGRLTLAQSVRLIEQGELLIANESGPMHIGVWCGTPVVGLVGGGHFGWFAPYPPQFPHGAPLRVAHQPMPCFRCNWHCKFDVPVGQAFPCVRDIEVNLVTHQALGLMGGVRHQKSS